MNSILRSKEDKQQTNIVCCLFLVCLLALSASGLPLRSTPDGSAAPVKDVNIARNASGLITQITDENGKSVFYTQDLNNDLTKVTDRVGSSTNFGVAPI